VSTAPPPPLLDAGDVRDGAGSRVRRRRADMGVRPDVRALALLYGYP